uniref:Scavenger receptor class B member 1 n=1 Tax=Ailuropoda melanoleuca TaxID=9646 RepID=A0A7N5KH28_AILME
MGSRARARRAAAVLGFTGLLCAVLGAVMIVLVPTLIKQQVLKNVRIDPSSLSFNMWKEIPVPFYLSVYFFDIVNPDAILLGEKPQVQERGPYVYREFRHKSNITFNDNDTVSFLEYRSFQFQPDKSHGLESDYIVMPNILVLAAAMMMENKPMSLKLIMTLAFSTLGERAFMNRTVGEIMWGYEDPLIHLINKYLPNMFPFKGKFGLFAELNNSDSGLFTVFTGVKDFSRIHLVDKWNGLSKVSFWHSDQCNMINGTSGQMWAPFMTPETSLEFYSPEACRSMNLIYKESGTFEGIPTYRFVAPSTLFANGSVYPPNEGFCPCRESGIQNVSTCRFNAPLFLSHPHFYNADPVLAEAVLGLHPNQEEHSLFLDIHPTNREDPARGPAVGVVRRERGDGRQAPADLLHPAGVDAQRVALRPVCPPRAGLRPAAHPRHPPDPEPSRWWPEQDLREGGAGGPLGVPPAASMDTLGLEPTLGSGPASLPGAGELSLRAYLSCVPHCHFSVGRGRPGDPPWERLPVGFG